MHHSFRKHVAKLLVGIPSLLVASGTLAGGPPVVVDFGPGALVGVPTLGTSALIALGVLLAIVALRASRGSGAGRAAAVVLFSAGLVSGGLGVERTLATSSFSVTSEGDCETGGSYVMFARGGNIFTNDCPNAMRILGYEFDNPESTCTLVPNNSESAPACVIGSPVAAGDQCALAVCDVIRD